MEGATDLREFREQSHAPSNREIMRALDRADAELRRMEDHGQNGPVYDHHIVVFHQLMEVAQARGLLQGQTERG